MLVRCEMCKQNDADVVTYTCCTGPLHRIECACGGEPQYEGFVVCGPCREIVEIVTEMGHCILVGDDQIETSDLAREF